MAGARVQARAQWLPQYGVPGAAWRSQNTQGRSALVIHAQDRRLAFGAGTVGCFLTVGILRRSSSRSGKFGSLTRDSSTASRPELSRWTGRANPVAPA
jgi:hypothetical protein